ncbi:MAG: dipeptide ABC transporter ATP-binding protein [bacterium]|nr:dipeptide ABC transporter ATP-binding protein [bacterium]MCP5069602.1 dipeptide ABC transporter ATP-binding protein [bacterium]
MSAEASDTRAPLLEVEGLVKHYPVNAGVFSQEVARVRAVDGVSFAIAPGETLGLVGESGCGKTTVGRTLLRLEEPTAGRVLFDGKDLATLARSELRTVRRSLQMVFQDPMSSLNPRMTVRDIIAEPLHVHRVVRGEALDVRVVELLEKVGLPGAWRNRYPHEFSGGQRQRVGVARALALGPKLIVCDEAVSALDVSVQAQVLNLLIDLREELGLSYLFISHDLSVVRHVSDRIAVMYLGQIVEVAPSARLFTDPVHPYTRALLSAIPVPDPRRKVQRIVLEGDVPSPMNPPPGCRFHTRCPAAMNRCRRDQPPLVQLPGGHEVSCFLADATAQGGDWRQATEERRRAAEMDRVATGRADAESGSLAFDEHVPEAASEPTPPAWVARSFVAALLAALLGLVVFAWPVSLVDRAMQQHAGLEGQLRAHADATGRWPERLRDLGWRLHEVFDDGAPIDPWGQPWEYTPRADGFSLRSFGPDGQPDAQSGAGDDIQGSGG